METLKEGAEDEPNTLSVNQVARIVGRSNDTIRRWIKAGILRGGHVLPGPKGGEHPELIYIVNKRVFLEWWESLGADDPELVTTEAE
jgi:transposase